MFGRSSTRHTVVLSDVHLSEAEPGDGDWLRYRQRRFFPDDDFVRLTELLRRDVRPGDSLDLVFGGDVFEFEGPRVVGGETSFEDRPRTEVDAIETTERILRDHTSFFAAVAAIAEAGHRIVFVVGNHDAQLTFRGVQAALRNGVAAHVPLERRGAMLASIAFYPWFFQTDDGIHVEHGHLYDSFCTFRDPFRPLDADGHEIQATVGSLAFRHLISRMGYFNAYDERTFMLSTPRYLLHWVRYYLFTRRSLAWVWFRGAIRVVAEVLSSRPARRLMQAIHEQAAVTRAAYAQALELDHEALVKHAELFAKPVDEAPHKVVRELRLDHAALAFVGVAGLVTAAFAPRTGLAIALGALVVGVAQELIAPRGERDDEYRAVDATARRIAKIYDARAVVFGHTHIPNADVSGEVLYANTGSWAPQADDEIGARTALKGRPVVWLRRPDDNGEAPIEGGLYRLRDGELVPEIVTGPSPEGREESEAPMGGGLALAGVTR